MDEDFNVWLIEVNTDPCIEEANPLLAMLLPRMLDDAFRLTIDVLFPRLKKPDNEELGRFKVKGCMDIENMWEHLGNMKEKKSLLSFINIILN